MKIKALLLICTLGIFQLASAQAIINVEKSYHDFGELKEGDPAVCTFEVVNTGNSPLIISKVTPSCGCTTPDWTKEPILPGAKGKISASYGTKGRPGSFNKSITVYSNDPEKQSFSIYIRGFVSNAATPVYTAEELRVSPKIVIEKSEHNFGKVEKSTKIPYKVSVTNLGRSDLRINEVTSACNCIVVNSKPEYIKSGETGIVQLIYSPNTIGIVQDIINIKSNDITKSNFKFTFNGNVVESLTAPSILKEGNSAVPFK